MKRIFTILLSVIAINFCYEASAQTNVSVDTSIPVSTQLIDVRYEFIQSTQNNFQAFLLDKYTGQIWKYRIGKKDFEELKIEDPDSAVPDKVNYQMYISGKNNSMCFLLNVHTGQMWRYMFKDGEWAFNKLTMPWDIESPDKY